MKIIFITLLAVTPLVSFSQTLYPTLRAAKEATKEGYKTSSGWVVKEGDRIQIGQGSTGNKKFAYIFNAPGITLDVSRTPLPTGFSNKLATVKRITFSGIKKTGFTTILVVGVGVLNNFYVEIDNALSAGEIIPPAEFAQKDAAPVANVTSSLADELKKLKDLLDTGALTQDEYDAAKKKLLGQ